MSGLNHPVYIEFLGLSGVGKSTTLKSVLTIFKDHKIVLRNGPKKGLVTNLYDTLRYAPRRAAFLQLFQYFRRIRGLSFWRAARCAAYITGFPAHRAHLSAGRGGVLCSDEGPTGYLNSAGGTGPAWSEFGSILMPEERNTTTFFIYLKASDETVLERLKSRGGGRKVMEHKTRCENGTHAARHKGRLFWLEEHRKAGANVLVVDTEGRSVEEITATVKRFILNKLGDASCQMHAPLGEEAPASYTLRTAGRRG